MPNNYFQPTFAKGAAGINGRFGVVGPFQTLQRFDIGEARAVVEQMKAELDDCLTEIEEEAERQAEAAREEFRREQRSRRAGYYATR
ncbi:MAG: hypothetical protein ACYDCO_01940 [Armatimonadota bacterium]